MNIKRTTTIELSADDLTEAVTLWAKKKRLARGEAKVTGEVDVTSKLEPNCTEPTFSGHVVCRVEG